MATVSITSSSLSLPKSLSSTPLHHFRHTARSWRRPKPGVSRCTGEPKPPPHDEPIVTTNTPPSSLPGISSYTWCAGIGAAGFLETSYLTFLKLTNADVFCPLGGGGGCGDVLQSPYAVVFGIPLPVFGMVAYGSVAALGLQLARNDSDASDETEGRIILLGLATSMATASACFLYILSTEFAGVSCPYCLFSAFLSFTLFFILLADFGFQGIQKVLGLQLAVATLVVAALTGSYSALQPGVPRLGDFELDLYETEITTESSPLAISLAKHLRSIGAKMYGAFWCSHCVEQKQMFGYEAMKIIDYVECFPDGAGKGRTMAKNCADLGLEGFPTWIINGQILNGEQDLRSLAEASGFISEDLTWPPVAVKP